MKQIKVAITDETKAYLDEQAQKNGRNLSEEVRVRIEQSQVDDRFDPATQELGRDVMWLALLLREGPAIQNGHPLPEATWDQDELSFEALKVAVEAQLNEVRSRLKLRPAPPNYEPIAVARGKSTANAYAHLKPMLIKHTPGGDNIGEKR